MHQKANGLFRQTPHRRRLSLLAGVGVLSLLRTLVAVGAETSAGTRPATCAPVQLGEDALVHLPFETVDGRIYVSAQVDGKGPFRFAVDTGASGFARADSTLVDALVLKPEGQSSTSDGVSTSKVETVHLASIQLDRLVRNNLDVITRDYGSHTAENASFSGILGREFFADGLLVIDFPGKTLSFTRTKTLPKEGEGVLVYERAFRVPVKIGSVNVIGNLDTGANVSFVLPQALYGAVATGPLEKAGQAQLTNGKLDLQRATVHGPFQLGALTLSDVEVRISDKYPEVLVGAHALQESVVLIDQRSKSIAICLP